MGEQTVGETFCLVIEVMLHWQESWMVAAKRDCEPPD